MTVVAFCGDTRFGSVLEIRAIDWSSGLSYDGSGQLDKGWKDDRVLLLDFSGESVFGYFLASGSFSGDGSRLGFVGGGSVTCPVVAWAGRMVASNFTAHFWF